jgi:3D (Asp-Asp-Asp) domain-containing protein
MKSSKMGKNWYAKAAMGFAMIVIGAILPKLGQSGQNAAEARTVLALSTSVTVPIERDAGTAQASGDINAIAACHGPGAANPAVVNYSPAQWHTIRMRVTGYCPCPICCGRLAQGRTANGHIIRPGDRFVAASKEYSFGTEIIVPQYNRQRPIKVLDRGGAITGNRLDLFFPSHRQAVKWGVKYLDVKVRTDQRQGT